MRPLWPTCAEDALPFAVHHNQGGFRWRTLTGAIDINPGSGEIFFDEKRIDFKLDADVFEIEQALDLTAHMFPRRIPREPSLVLYAGADVTASGFIAGLVSAHFSLDEIGIPNDVLLHVTLEIGRTRLFQDALIDQVFHPRPIDIMRRHRLISTETVHIVDAPFLPEAALRRARDRIEKRYGPFDREGPPVVLCNAATERAGRLIEACPPDIRSRLGAAPLVLDPEETPLRILIRSLAAAPLILLPEGDEFSLLALLPRPLPSVVEVPLDQRSSPLACRIKAALTNSRKTDLLGL